MFEFDFSPSDFVLARLWLPNDWDGCNGIVPVTFNQHHK